MKTKLILQLLSTVMVIILLCSCAPVAPPETESAESGTDAQTEEVKEAEYSVTSFDRIDRDAVKQIVVSDCNTWKTLTVTDEDKISEIVDLVNGAVLSYTGSTSQGVYDARVSIAFYNENGNEAYSSINLHNGGSKCEYKINRKTYYETGREYYSIYDIEDDGALFKAVSGYLPIE